MRKHLTKVSNFYAVLLTLKYMTLKINNKRHMNKKIILSALCLIFLFSFQQDLTAQSSLTINGSQVYSTFKFTDSSGEKIKKEYNGIYSGAYDIGFRYAFDFGAFVHPSIGMRSAGATLVYDDMNYLWDFDYFNFKLGLGYMYDMGRFSPYLKVSPYFGYLLHANQTLNNENIDIIDLGVINKTDFGIYITPGVFINLSDYISTYIEFDYMMGLANLEVDDTQKGKNSGISLSLGLSFSITKLSE